MKDIKYVVFFVVAFGLIGCYLVDAWRLWDRRVAVEIEQATMAVLK